MEDRQDKSSTAEKNEREVKGHSRKREENQQVKKRRECESLR